MIGGGNSVQIYETVIYKGKLVLSPSQMYDEIPGCSWLVGIIESRTGKLFVKSRKIETLTAFISRHVKIGTLIISDGYTSHLSAVKNSFCNDEIVNYSMGLKTPKDIIQIT
jgi:hypothetical protein